MKRSDLLKRVAGIKASEVFKAVEGREMEFDIPAESVPEIKERFEKLKKGEISHREFSEFMVVRLEALGIRTVQMVNMVAEKTGIKFPHVVQQYVEFFLLTALNPCTYRVKESTRWRISIEVDGCQPHINSCTDMCRNVVLSIGEVREVGVKCRIEKADGKCTFTILPKEGSG